MGSPRLRRLNAAFLVVGAVALSWTIYRIGPAELWRALSRLKLWFVVTSGAHLAGLLLDSITLRACAGRPGRGVPYWAYVRVSVAGHAINEATPLSKLGEVTKYTLLSERLPGERAAAALIVQNFVMFVTNCALLTAAPLVAFYWFDVLPMATAPFATAAVLFAVLGGLGLWLLSRGVGTWPFALLARLGVSGERLSRWKDAWMRVEIHWHEATRDRLNMVVAWLSAILSRCASISEAAMILYFLGAHTPIAAGVLSLAGYQLVSWTTPFVPLQAGTAEGGSYVVFRAAGIVPQLGVILELIRKVRRLLFIGLGVTVLGWQTFRQLARPAGPSER